MIAGQALIAVELGSGAAVAFGQGQGLAPGIQAAASVGGAGVAGGLAGSEVGAAVW